MIIWYTHPEGYFNWDQQGVIALSSARWWINLLDGRHVTLLIQGQRFEAIPNVIHERDAVTQTVGEFYKRLGLKKARMLPLGLPTDRQPTPEELQTIPAGIAFVRFELIGHA